MRRNAEPVERDVIRGRLDAAQQVVALFQLGRLGGDEAEDHLGDALLKQMLKARSVLVSEPVTDKLARRVQSQLILLQMNDEKSPITVYINSPGGSADSGFAIYDALRFFKPPVRTVVTGLCASAAVMIYLAPPKERRFSLPNSRFLLHQPSTYVQGSASDIEISASETSGVALTLTNAFQPACSPAARRTARKTVRSSGAPGRATGARPLAPALAIDAGSPIDTGSGVIVDCRH